MNRVSEFQTTPNPNALKCVLERPIPGPIRSHRGTAGTESDPLAAALLALPGVTSVLISGDWLTVNKSPQTDWPTLKPAIQRVLAEVPGDLPAPSTPE